MPTSPVPADASADDLDVVALLAAKRDGAALDPADVRRLVDGYTRGAVPDYQMSAFLMAAYIRGLDDAEAAALTDAMLHSGRTFDLAGLDAPKVGKHSTGGVGDVVSLVLAPLVAACGVTVPKVSGRGLGHTGGTLDKLEAIPGFRVDLAPEAYKRQLADLGLAIIGQSDTLAPADRKLYALRDVTATVAFVPFIAASIMSKKLAEGLDALVLDVKCGRGAFMQTEAEARRLAETLVAIGTDHGVPTVALMTAMDAPLADAAGTWPEVAEAVAALRGERAEHPLTEVTLALAGEMLTLAGVAPTPDDGRAMAAEALSDGRALARFRAFVRAQGGEVRALATAGGRDDAPPAVPVYAERAGFVAAIDARAVGHLAVDLGAGRRTKDDDVDPTAGVALAVRVGDRVEEGATLARLYTRHTHRTDAFAQALRAAVTLGDTAAPTPAPLVLGRCTADGWTAVT
jgi:pyrimidine-nucleoside phosphorylase